MTTPTVAESMEEVSTVESVEEVQEAVVEEEEVENVEIAADVTPAKKDIPCTLPLSRVKKIIKLDPDIRLITLDAVKIITFATERFIELLARASAIPAKEEGRKTVQLKDINRAIKRSWLFYMLEDALEDWPDKNAPSKAGKSTSEEHPTVELDADPDIEEIPLAVTPTLDEDEAEAEEPEGNDGSPNVATLEESDLEVVENNEDAAQ